MFSIKFRRFAQTSVNVNVSARMLYFMFWDAVAGDPHTSAVTASVVRGVTCVGIPTMTPLESKESPVPDNPGADNTTGNPDAAVALN
jgi:hypothetical protein